MTDEVRAIIGAQSPWAEATNAVEPSGVRGFFHAIIDPEPIYWDENHAKQSRYDHS